MKKLAKIVCVIIVLSLTACASNPSIMSLDPHTRAKVSKIAIMEGNPLPAASYEITGTVKGLSCKRNAYSSKIAMPQEAIDGIRIKAAQLDADAVINVLCQPSTGVDWGNNCWESIQCIGDLIKITDYSVLSMIQERNGSEEKENNAVKSGTSYGTGWIVHPGYVVTNFHVVEDKSSFELIKHNGERVKANLIGKDRHNDIAVLKPSDLSTLPLAIPLASASVQTGMDVFTIGYPHPDIMGSNPKLTNGIISSISGLQDDPRFYQTTVSLQAGNSGGPLLNQNGEAIGITTAKLNSTAVYGMTGDLPENVNYALKIDYLKILLGSLPSPDPPIKSLPVLSGNLSILSDRITSSVLIVEAK